MEPGKLGVWYYLDGMRANIATATAQRIEALGYSTLWIPESTGRNPFAHAGWLLANTTRLNIATGIASIYHREAGVTLAGQQTLAELSDDRFLLGLGVSHQIMVEGIRNREYAKPLATMRAYLQAMDAAPYTARRPAVPPARVIAALGPKMLELARDTCAGAHPFFTSVEHTAIARKILGPNKWLCVEQRVLLDANADTARTTARAVAQRHLALPNYRNNWLSLGFNEADLANGGSDRFIDATCAWGSVDKIKERIATQYAAGASHVCLHPLNPNGRIGDLHWPVLEQLSDLA